LAGCFPATGRLWLTVATRGFNVSQSSFQIADSSIRIILNLLVLETMLEVVSIFAMHRSSGERQYVPASEVVDKNLSSLKFTMKWHDHLSVHR